MPEGIDLVRITGERVETRRQSVHAVHEEAQVDAWAPRNRIPWHRSPTSGWQKPPHHPEERLAGDGGRCVHAHGTSAPEDHSLGGERAGAHRRSEDLLVRREAGEVLLG